MSEIQNGRLSEQVKFNATLFSYYIICPRKAWFFWYGIGMERHSELVEIGKLITETTYSRQKHEISIDEVVALDWVDWKNKIIHEVKKSKALEEAHEWQVKYYLWILEQKGLTGFKGIINYPKHMKIKEVVLTDEDRQLIPKVITEMEQLFQKDKPPMAEKKPFCRKCAYFEMCWV